MKKIEDILKYKDFTSEYSSRGI